MHWLAQKLDALHDLARRFVALRSEPARPESEPLVRRARNDFHQAIRGLVDEVTQRRGVTASFASHEGLIIAVAGKCQPGDEEAWAAMAQVCLSYSERTATTLSLGHTQQIVIVGASGKLVLFPIESMVLGVLSPTGVSLSEVLAA